MTVEEVVRRIAGWREAPRRAQRPRVATSLAVALLCAGCVSPQMEVRVAPQPITLVSRHGFELRPLTEDGQRTAQRCTVRRLHAAIDSVHGESMYLRNVQGVQLAEGSRACGPVRRAVVVPSQDPTMYAETRRVSFGATLGLVLTVALGTLLVVFVRDLMGQES